MANTRELLKAANAKKVELEKKQPESIVNDIASAVPFKVNIISPERKPRIKKSFDLDIDNAQKLHNAAIKYNCKETEIINQILEQVIL